MACAPRRRRRCNHGLSLLKTLRFRTRVGSYLLSCTQIHRVFRSHYLTEPQSQRTHSNKTLCTVSQHSAYFTSVVDESWWGTREHVTRLFGVTGANRLANSERLMSGGARSVLRPPGEAERAGERGVYRHRTSPSSEPAGARITRRPRPL